MKKTFTLELAEGYPIEFLDIPRVATNMPRAGEIEFIDTPRGKLAIPKTACQLRVSGFPQDRQ